MRLTPFLLLLPFLTFGQKWVSNVAQNPIDNKQATRLLVSGKVALDTVSIKAFLKTRIANLKQEQVGLVLENQVSSPKAQHYRFAQTLNGRTVFRGDVKINIDNQGKVLSLFDNTFSIPENIDAAFPEHTAYHNGLMEHYKEVDNGKLHHYDLQEVYYSFEEGLIPAIRLEVVENTDRYYEMVLNKAVRVIYQNDLLCYAAPQDSLATLWVFNPDPVSSAGVTYGAPYTDNSDTDVLELNAERIAVQTPVTFENGTFYLRGPYVSIEEFSFPETDETISLTGEFNFTRSEPGFEDANAYYHINHFQQYIQSLGFNNIANYPIHVDAHALNGSDNSNFNPGFNPPRLSFGEGGVDDAEDADVIIHEYGHAITHSAAPGTNTGSERQALDEAVGDYFASSYSRFLNNFGWKRVFSWDGHNEFWQGRLSMSQDHYPEDLDGNIYTDTDIWSATLMQIWGDIGREATDAIMLQAIYSFSSGMSMPDAALLFLQADTLLFNGANFTPIRQRMFDRGLIPWNVGIEERIGEKLGFQVFNSAGFASGTAPLQIVSDQPFKVNLYNALGQLLLTKDAEDGNLTLSGNKLSSGIFVASVEIDGKQEAFKLIKY